MNKYFDFLGIDFYIIIFKEDINYDKYYKLYKYHRKDLNIWECKIIEAGVLFTIKVIGGNFSKRDIDKIIYRLFDFTELRKLLRKKEKEKNYYKRLDEYNIPWEFPERKTNDEIEEYYRVLNITGKEIKST